MFVDDTNAVLSGVRPGAWGRNHGLRHAATEAPVSGLESDARLGYGIGSSVTLLALLTAIPIEPYLPGVLEETSFILGALPSHWRSSRAIAIRHLARF